MLAMERIKTVIARTAAQGVAEIEVIITGKPEPAIPRLFCGSEALQSRNCAGGVL